MAAVQVAVSLHTRVDDPAVQSGAHLEITGPVLGRELRLETGQVLVPSADEPSLNHAGPPALAVPPTEPAGKRAIPHVQLGSVALDPLPPEVEPWTAGDPKPQRQPVGDVDQVLVLDLTASDVADQPVVKAGDVGTRVVDTVGLRFGKRATGHEIPIAQRAQRLAQALALGVEPVVDQRPDARRPLRAPAPDLRGGPAFLQPTFAQRWQ